MKQPELNNKLLQTLQEFEKMENIQPSADWNKSLMDRLTFEKSNSSFVFSSSKFAFALLFIVFLINIGFLYSTIINDSHQTLNRNNDLEVIYKELLINSN